MFLILAPLQMELTVVKINADEKTSIHLRNLGIYVNTILTVISNQSGTIICQVKEGRLVLDANLSSLIQVKGNYYGKDEIISRVSGRRSRNRHRGWW
jgi:Fe2+ transport system protein FeoA